MHCDVRPLERSNKEFKDSCLEKAYIYFADVASKSGNYCYPAKGKCALLMLSEVALGEPQILRDANYSADKLEQGKDQPFGITRIVHCLAKGNFMDNWKTRASCFAVGPLEDQQV
ncbi:hypothetical protein OSTOST_21420 [Ostertagia ostertagi]